VAALFVALGLADQRKLYWRLSSWRYRNPEANEPSDTAYTIGRVVVFAAAGTRASQGGVYDLFNRRHDLAGSGPRQPDPALLPQRPLAGTQGRKCPCTPCVAEASAPVDRVQAVAPSLLRKRGEGAGNHPRPDRPTSAGWASG
jgi:hypothetical protein